MSIHHSADASEARGLVAALASADDVRGVADARCPSPSPGLLRGLKLEVDRISYADRATAARAAEAAAHLAERAGDAASRAFAEAALARVRYVEGDHRDAERLYASARDALGAAGRSVDAAALAKQHLVALMYLGRYAEALALARSARRALRAHGDDRLLGEHEFNVGLLYYHLDRYRAALSRYDRAAALLEEIGDPAALALLDHNRAAVLFEVGRFDDAARLYDRAAEAHRKAGAARSALRAELSVAYTHFLRGRYQEALVRLRAVERDPDDALTELDHAMTSLDLAEVYLRLNALPEATEAAARAGERFAAAGMSRELGNARRVEGLAALSAGDDARASALLAEAVSLFDGAPQEAAARLALAEALLRGGAWDEAAATASAAGRTLAANRSAARAHAAVLEARARLGAGDAASAERLARSALAAATKAENEWVEYQCHHVVARALAAEGRDVAALAAYGRAVDAVDRMRSRVSVDDFKLSFVEDKVALYEEAVVAYLAAAEPSTAAVFRVLELSKSRALADLLSAYLREVAPGDPEGRDARESFARLVAELAGRAARDDAASDPPRETDAGRRDAARVPDRSEREAAVGEAFRRLQLEDARFAEADRSAVVSLDEARALVEPGEVMLEYAVAASSVSAVVISSDGVTIEREIASVADVRAALDGLDFQTDAFLFGSAFAERQRDLLRRSADRRLARLYDLLVRPIEPLLADRDLIVIPHGLLHYVPVHALFDGTAYVVERRGVVYAPSASVYAICVRSRRTGDGPALLCGVEDAAAPEIAREVAALSGLLPDARRLFGGEATREAFAHAAEGCRYVHVASHASFRADNPLLSSLRLADGELTFYDVFSLRLSADLVVLSGCNTGRSAVAVGDELVGLVRGFLYAGCPSLLTSLWSADDGSTARLMSDFYGALLAGATKRDALRAAQRAAIAREPHPYYWAGFTLMGRPG